MNELEIDFLTHSLIATKAIFDMQYFNQIGSNLLYRLNILPNYFIVLIRTSYLRVPSQT